MFEVEQVGEEPHNDPLLLALPHHRRRTWVKGTHGEAEQDLVHHLRSQELRELFEAANQPESGPMKLRGAAPVVVHEPDDAIPQFRLRFDFSREADGPGIGPHDEDVSQIPAVNPELPQGISEEEATGQREDRAGHPEHEKKDVVGQLDVKEK